MKSNFYPRPPGGGRPRPAVGVRRDRLISIHALRVEGDTRQKENPCKYALFLSTPSGWRATGKYKVPTAKAQEISIHALRVEGDAPRICRLKHLTISIHALRVEGDFKTERFPVRQRISIHALRVEGDKREAAAKPTPTISIHALRVEGDWLSQTRACCLINFYPRPPGGGRRPFFVVLCFNLCKFLSTPSGWRATFPYWSFDSYVKFLSTPSGWRATRAVVDILSIIGISIHALRVEGDRCGQGRRRRARNFYPRPPGGGRLMFPGDPSGRPEISIHALRVEGDPKR